MDSIKQIAEEIKTKVLNLTRTPLEIALHEATSNDNWGINPRVLREISDQSYKRESRQTIINFILRRLIKKNHNWRKILKTLVLIDYLLKNGLGSISEIFRENVSYIKAYQDLTFLENGVDKGISIRQKVEQIITLLNDDNELQYQRQEARILTQKSINLKGFGSNTDSNSSITNADNNKINEKVEGINDNNQIKQGSSNEWDNQSEQDEEDEKQDPKNQINAKENIELNANLSKKNKFLKKKEIATSDKSESHQNNKISQSNQLQSSSKAQSDPWEWGLPEQTTNKDKNIDEYSNSQNIFDGFWSPEGYNEEPKLQAHKIIDHVEQTALPSIQEQEAYISEQFKSWKATRPIEKEIIIEDEKLTKKEVKKEEFNLLDLDLLIEPTPEKNENQNNHSNQEQPLQRDYSALETISPYQQFNTQQQQMQYGYYYQNQGYPPLPQQQQNSYFD